MKIYTPDAVSVWCTTMPQNFAKYIICEKVKLPEVYNILTRVVLQWIFCALLVMVWFQMKYDRFRAESNFETGITVLIMEIAQSIKCSQIMKYSQSSQRI